MRGDLWEAGLIYDLAIFWLKSMAVLYYMVSTALYLDQERDLIRRHCQSPKMVALKMLFAPVTIVYIVWRITIAWPKFIWTHRIAGCFVGNRPPVAVPRRRPTGPATAVSSSCCRNAIMNTQGPHSIVNDDALAEMEGVLL